VIHGNITVELSHLTIYSSGPLQVIDSHPERC